MISLKHNNFPIISLIGISLAVHIIVFFAIHHFSLKNVETSIIPPYQQSSSFSVTIEKTQISTDNIKSSQKEKLISLENKELTSIKNNNTSNLNKNSTKIQQVKKPIKISQKNKALLLRHVKSEISHHFNYPTFARRKGWHGKVLLEFNISHSGIINNIKIKNSSGYDILDQAAHKSLSHIQRVKTALNMDLPINTLLHVPIVYQLTEG